MTPPLCRSTHIHKRADLAQLRQVADGLPLVVGWDADRNEFTIAIVTDASTIELRSAIRTRMYGMAYHWIDGFRHGAAKG